jgi:hypothetical protein
MAMAPAMIEEAGTGGNQPVNHDFEGIHFAISPFGDFQTIKIVYANQQLLTSLYPAFMSAFRAHGFDDVPWEDLLYVLTVGGEIDLKGKKFINRQAYAPHTMDRLFMRRERALVSELMTIVFNRAGNVSYMRELAPFEEVLTRLQFDASIAMRKTIMLYHALHGPEADTYREKERICAFIGSSFSLPAAGIVADTLKMSKPYMAYRKREISNFLSSHRLTDCLC